VLTAEEQCQTMSHPGIVVGEHTFAMHMEVLRRHFTVLSIEEFADHIERKRQFASSSCLITFDDGWRDNFTTALPLLRKEGLPALVFLPVNFIGQRKLFWREALTHLVVLGIRRVRSGAVARERLHAVLTGAGLEQLLETCDEDARPQVIAAIASRPRLILGEMERVATALASELDVRLEELATADTFMDWEQVQVMARHRVAFGGHGAEHRLLTDLAAADARAEIEQSKTVLDRTLDERVATFSYPNGNWRPDIAETVKSCGYRLAFTTRPGRVRCDDDPFTLRRMNIHEAATATKPMFLARVVGLF
jgi:peptidoglycan/xylan/chitin deacetylase (PgdA/CDA1 family)